MILSYGKTKRERWTSIAVVSLCLLVLVFSFAAKLSLYQPQVPPIKSLAAGKLWHSDHSNTAAAAVELKKSSMLPLFLFALQLLAALPLMREWLKDDSKVAVRLRDIASESQLRAPPIR